MKTWLTVAILTVAAISGVCKDKVKEDRVRAFDASTDRVYAGMVQTLGGTLKTAVKEACTVNAEAHQRIGLGSYWSYANTFFTAVCRDNGHGMTTVSIRTECQGDWCSSEKKEDEFVRIFWANLQRRLSLSQKSESSGGQDQGSVASSHDNLATVTVKATPENSDITVDGRFAGSSPSVLRLPAGDHIISIASKGHRAWERLITLTDGGATTINATLELDAPTPQR
jgi:hypothetical protein